MQNNFFDVAIVGSGPSGIHSAYPLVNAGLKVAIIDGGLDMTSDVFQKTNQILKIQSNIKINQSLAKGGLSEVWPGICDYFTTEELTQIGLPAEEILREYKEVAGLIRLKQKPLLNMQGKSILNSSKKVYRLSLAFPYHTSRVVDEFKKFKNFTYIPNQLVLKVADRSKHVEIQSLSINDAKQSSIKAHFVILAAGSLNTTRVLLRSFNLYNQKVPFLTKGNYMIVCLLPRVLKKNKLMTSSGQVAISNTNFFIQFYKATLSSLEKGLQYIPLPKKMASLIFGILAPFLIIADVRFETSEGEKRFLKLKRNKAGEDTLEISFHQTKKELQDHKFQLKKIQRMLFSSGLIPLKILKGSVTYHYAGGIPIKKIPGVLSCDFNGKLHQAKRIYIADSSTWQALPAKPPTLTIMANARRVGKLVLKKIKN